MLEVMGWKMLNPKSDFLRSRRYLAYGALMLIMTAVLMIMLLSYERGHALLVGPLTMAVSAAAAMCLSGRWRRLPAVYWVGFALVLWHAFSRVVGGDHYIQMYDSRMNVAGLTTIFGLAFPCAFYLKDERQPAVLGAVLAACTCFFALVNGLGIAAAATGRVVYLPFFGNEFGIMRDGRLWVLGRNPFYTSFFGVCGALLAPYLAARWGSRKWLLPVLALEWLFLTSVRMSASRSGIILCCAGVPAALMLMLAQWWPGLRRRRYGVLCLLAAASAAILCLLAAPHIVSPLRDLRPRRSITADLPSFTGRTEVWAAIFPLFRDHPLRLLTGFLENRLVGPLNKYTVTTTWTHMHNAYLQTLVLGGVPALMLALLLTVGAFASGLKVLRSHPSCALRILVVFQLVFWVQMQIEPYLFIDSSLFNFLFFLTTGYIVEEARALPPLFAKKRS